MEIHIERSIINGSAVGEGNKIILGNGDIDWEKLEKEWLELFTKLPVETEEYKRSGEALQTILKKDKNGLVKILNSFAHSFTSSLFAGAASPFLTDFIRKFI